MEARPDAEWWRGQLGAALTLRTADGDEHTARLDACDLLAAPPGAIRADPFRLVATLEPGDAAGQGTYEVSGPGDLDELIFWVPIGPDANGRQQLEAIFN